MHMYFMLYYTLLGILYIYNYILYTLQNKRCKITGFVDKDYSRKFWLCMILSLVANLGPNPTQHETLP